MWGQACDLLDQAERLHRQFFRLTTSRQARPVWEPPVDVFEDEELLIVVVALPGARAECVEVILEGAVLLVRAETQMPFRSRGSAVRRLEIPYGYFERRIEVPELQMESATREFVDGCLIIKLRKAH